jgi:hypothetical protein
MTAVSEIIVIIVTMYLFTWELHSFRSLLSLK